MLTGIDICLVPDAPRIDRVSQNVVDVAETELRAAFEPA
jgi:hypothetical protein